MQLDYANIMRAGQQLVPNLREQLVQDRQLDQRDRVTDMQVRAYEAQAAKAERAAQREQQFQRDYEGVLDRGGDPGEIQQLMVRYPELGKTLKPMWESMDERQRARETTQVGTIFTRARGGNFEGAAELLAERIAADKAAGQDTALDEQILEGLRSPDPAARNSAIGDLGVLLASATGDKFGEMYGRLNPDATPPAVQREYDWRAQEFGKAAADQWLATQDTSLVTVEPGGSVFNKSDFVSGGSAPQPEGGDPSGSPGGLVATPEQEAVSAWAEQRFGLPFEGASFDQAAQQFGAKRGGGRKHNGLDFSGPLGTPVMPVLAGKVTSIGSDPRSGRFVRVKHDDGSVSSYSHLGDVTVQKGQRISRGDSLGTLGLSGNARAGAGRGVLHLVLRDKNGKAVDPAPLFGGATRVSSKQQYDRLPSGTSYIAPDGSRRVKP